MAYDIIYKLKSSIMLYLLIVEIAHGNIMYAEEVLYILSKKPTTINRAIRSIL